MKFTNILVPFDKSDHALHALTLAKGLAEEDPAIKLHVIGVVFVSDIPPALGLDATRTRARRRWSSSPTCTRSSSRRRSTARRTT